MKFEEATTKLSELSKKKSCEYRFTDDIVLFLNRFGIYISDLDIYIIAGKFCCRCDKNIEFSVLSIFDKNREFLYFEHTDNYESLCNYLQCDIYNHDAKIVTFFDK